MAGAEAAVHKLNVEKPKIPERLLKGSKFLKWPKSDGDDTIAVPITLRVDPKGHVLYWHEPNKDRECLEISSIRDTRCGKYAKEPKDPNLGKMVSNSSIPLSERCFTIVYGVKLIELTFLNFIAVENRPHTVVKEWADFLLTLAYHPCTRHLSVQTSIEKAFTKLKLETNQFGEIPVKKLYKLLGGRKRVENVLSSVGLITSKKNSTIDPEEFQLPRFKKLLQLCCQRLEMDTVFSELGRGAKRMYISQTKFKEFINTVQRDPKLNEILYPFITEDQAMEYIQQNEPNVMFAQKGQLTQEGFDAYLQSDENLLVGFEKYAEYQDMSQSISHYFINSSHNTYLTGTQYRSRSSAEMYRQVLLTGCRCVELDCWEGDDEPIINHGFTLCSPISFREVIEAINESAFKTSPYPVILSFENHVDNPQQQAKMAQYCRDIFKEKLLIEPLENHSIEPAKMLPPPKELLYKIIVKNKKQKQASASKVSVEDASKERSKSGSIQSETPLLKNQRSLQHRPSLENGKASRSNSQSSDPKKPNSPTTVSCNESEISNCTGVTDCEVIPEVSATHEQANLADCNEVECNQKLNDEQHSKPELQGTPNKSQETATINETNRRQSKPENTNGGGMRRKESNDDEDDDEDDEEDGSLTTTDFEENAKDCGTAVKESKAYGAMSSLVNYIQPIRFKSFDLSEKRNRSHEISSFTETSALRLLTFSPIEFVCYNRRQTSRIYPKGARVDSSNYNPQIFWNAGCQFVALNFQILDLPMQLNMGLFECNGGTGYLIKPEHMRKKDRMFDPFAQNIDGIVATTLTIRVISGQFLSSQRLSTYVEVDMYGLPNDTFKKQFKTKTVDNNCLNPHYNSAPFVFEKIILPSLAVLRIAVSDAGGNLMGQRFFKVDGLKPGYRYITLRNEGNQPLTMPSVFVHVQMKDFVPEFHKDLADALANPIPYLKEKEKEEKEIRDRKKAIDILMDVNEKKLIPSFVPDPTPSLVKERKRVSETPAPCLEPVISPGAKPDKPDQSFSQAVDKFEPQTLNDMYLGKPYIKLKKEFKNDVEKFKRKQKHTFDKHYNEAFGNAQKASLFSAFKSLGGRRRPSTSDLSIDLNPSLPDEVKKSELIKLLKSHFSKERDYKHGKVPEFIEEFDKIVKERQKEELKKLHEMDKKEQEAVQKQKNVEKEVKIKGIPSTLSKEEVEKKKADINSTYFNECVKFRTRLAEKQEERERDVQMQQGEIVNSLEEERKTMQKEFEEEYQENLTKVNDIYERRKAELAAPRKNSVANNSTLTLEQDGEYVTLL